MSDHVDPRQLYEWCRIPADELAGHPGLRVPFRMVEDAREMARLMAEELASLVAARNAEGRATRAIVPCGPTGWYAPWTEMVNARGVSLARLTVFHMDECLDWQGRPLPKGHPYNFRTFMERHFYGGIRAELNVPPEQRLWLAPATIERVREAIAEEPVDLTLGGWGQDGHVAYNQARRHPFHHLRLEDLAASTVRVQDNNLDTVLALAQRTFGAAYQFVPPMSVTLGIKECLSARKVRVFSDTGSWKQTALRVALFSEPVAEYPMTLLQRHADALVTATRETARHPISENPQWELF
jgi:glucosamine-6-phosphate deaminase